MTDDDQLVNLFARIDFADEPAPAGTALDDARRGHRRLVRRRAALPITGGVGIAAAATAVALLLPGGSPWFGEPGGDVPVMAPPGSSDEYDVPFELTRTALLDNAKEHFDPEGDHLLDSAADLGFTGGGAGKEWSVGTFLSWTVPGEEGIGLVHVAVTTPDHLETGDHALENFADALSCEVGSEQCVEQTVPGTDMRAWVATGPTERGGYPDLELAVVLERADGSLVGMSAGRLFGNNTTVPVSEVGITLDQAFAFLTDPDVVVAPEEVEDGSPEGSGEGLPEDFGTEATP